MMSKDNYKKTFNCPEIIQEENFGLTEEDLDKENFDISEDNKEQIVDDDFDFYDDVEE